MRIHIAKFEPDRTGGGWAWQNNFTKLVKHSNYKDADIYMIAGASMVDKETKS